MLLILRRIFTLTRLAVSGPGAWWAAVLYVAALGFQFAGVWISVRLIAWSKAFYDALENKDAGAAITEVINFGILIGSSAAIYLLGDWLKKRLFLFLRQRLTERVQQTWLNNKAYWHLRPGYSTQAIDNPDQRIAEDCRLFVHRLLEETLDLISRVVGLTTYIAVLWSLSSFSLAFSLFGMDFSVPNYMVWCAFLYVALSSFVTHVLGRPIKGLVFAQERQEANFRHALVQLREGADEIAQASGEAAEGRRLSGRFAAIRANWFRLINAELVLGIFVRPYFQTVLRIPTFLALPAYFAGSVTLGGLMQLASAFSRVVTSLSWFIFSYRDLAEFAAVSERLDTLLKAASDPVSTEAKCDVKRTTSADGCLRLKGLALTTPQGLALSPVPDTELKQGEALWVCGPSGAGKSTFLSALSGLWPFGSGHLEVPDHKVLALPQVPRVFPEGFEQAACYPLSPAEVGRDAIVEALGKVGLGHRLYALEHSDEEGYAGLSVGERQRLALVRVLLLRPDFLILDEATSALDAESEAEVLALIRRELPACTIVCAAHRPPTALGDFKTLSLARAHEASASHETAAHSDFPNAKPESKD